MQANVEYWFRLLYELIYGSHASVDFQGISALIANIWVWIVGVGYTLSVIALFGIVYCMVRLFELREHEEEYFHTLLTPPGVKEGMHPRWEHIQKLLASTNVSEWREAIIEADIMLDDALSAKGYLGNGVGDKLKGTNEKKLGSLQDAWEAHKVRNQIAHQGSTYVLSESLARRTIAYYESVFNELEVI